MPRLSHLEQVLFPVDEHPVFVSVKGLVGELRLPVPGRKAIVNAHSSQVLGIVSRDYRLVTNREALDWAHQCCRAVFPDTKTGEWEVQGIDAPGTAGYCRIDLVHNSTALDFSFVPAKQRPEVFGPFIRVTNSYNGMRALAFDIGFFRKVCRNGLIFPDSIIRFRFTHQTRDIDKGIRFEVAHGRLAKLIDSFSAYLGVLKSCAVPRPEFEPLVLAVLALRQPKSAEPGSGEEPEWTGLLKHLGAMNDRYARDLGENAYAVLNVVTEFASKPPANRCVHRDRHGLQRLAGAWLNSFSRECVQPGFEIKRYLERRARASARAAPATGRPAKERRPGNRAQRPR